AAYRHWASGEPNNSAVPNYYGGEDYTCVNWDAVDGAWNDWDHRQAYYYKIDGIAEYPLSDLSIDAFGGNDFIKDVENVNGTQFDDIIEGDENVNMIEGGAGSDIIIGNGGNDVLHGGSGDDEIFGGAGVDYIIGESGDDTINGEEGNDIIEWNSGDDNDYVTPGNGSDTIKISGAVNESNLINVYENLSVTTVSVYTSSSLTSEITLAYGGADDIIDITTGNYADTVIASSISGGGLQYVKVNLGGGDDLFRGTLSGGILKVYGQAGNDTLSGGTRYDLLDGGDGIDTIAYSDLNSGSGVIVNLHTGLAADDGYGSVDTIVNVENVIGSQYTDTLTGDAIDNVLVGLGGADTISGLDGNDVIYGGDTTDSFTDIERAADNDTIDGGSGNDRISGGAGNDVISGGAGDDIIYGYYSYDDISAPDLANDANDTIYGQAGNDTIDGGSGEDYVDGGEGDDLAGGGRGNDIIIGGEGHDTVFNPEAVEAGAVGVLTRLGSGDEAGPVYYNPDTGHLYGVVSSGTSGSWQNAEDNAVLNGGHLVTINDASEEAWLRQVFGNSGRYWIGLTDNVTEGSWEWISGETATYRHWSTGEPNNSAVPNYTGGEDFTCINWDTVDGAWNDWDHRQAYYYKIDGIAEYTFNDMSIDAFGGNDIVTGFDVIRGTSLADTLYGNQHNNTIYGGLGHDTIDAGGGDDLVSWNMGDGVDVVTLGDGRDVLDISADMDNANNVMMNQLVSVAVVDIEADGVLNSIYVETNGSDDMIKLTTGSEDDDVRVGSLTGITQVEAYLGEGDDFFDGSRTDSTLSVYGQSGNDTLRGGSAVDTLVGGDGSDTADYSGLYNNVGAIVNLSAGRADDDGNGSVDTLTGFENVKGSDFDDTITGNNGNNIIIGLGGNDYIDALGGDDLIYGNAGDDTIIGGEGDDFIDGGAGSDSLNGFAGQDIIFFSGATIGINLELENNSTGTVNEDGTGSIDTLLNVDGAVGTEFFDYMRGNDSDNEFHGRGGDDVLRGNGGNDIIDGGEGIDLVEGGTGEDLLLGGAGDDIVYGGAGDDLIISGVGDDRINTGLGDDQVVWDEGNDVISAESSDSVILVSDDTLLITPVNDEEDNRTEVSTSDFSNTVIVRGTDDIEQVTSSEGTDMVETAIEAWNVVSFEGSPLPVSSATVSANDWLKKFMEDGTLVSILP
ncbi:MAG: hypothetical protein JW915_23550, partial [Chitinispirillaceae bacterium]|nr:hypothetical protein [Chitinispirillaceae bacterium]